MTDSEFRPYRIVLKKLDGTVLSSSRHAADEADHAFAAASDALRPGEEVTLRRGRVILEDLSWVGRWSPPASL